MTFATYLKFYSTNDVLLRNVAIFFWTTISRGALMLKVFSDVFCKILLFSEIKLFLLFCKINLIAWRSVFCKNILWIVVQEHIALNTWKRYYSIVHRVSFPYVWLNASLHETLRTYWINFISLPFSILHIYNYLYIECLFRKCWIYK